MVDAAADSVDDAVGGVPGRSVGDIASRELLSCASDTPVGDAAQRMAEAHLSSIIVVEDGHAVGIWTERDALAIDFSSPAGFERPIREAMASPVRTIAASASVGEAGLAFKNERVRHLLVVDDAGLPTGMLSQTDIVLNHGVEQYLTLRDVRSVMTREATLLPPGIPLAEATRRMRAAGADAAIVLEDADHGAGMLTERDLVRLAAKRRHAGTVGAVASRPLVSVKANAPLLTARNLFAKHGIRHLAVRDEGGGFVGLLSFADILTTLQYEYIAQLNATLRERDEALMRSHQDLFLARQVIEASLEGVIIVEAGGVIEYVNPAFTRLTGWTAEEALGKSPRILKSGLHDEAFYGRMWQELTDRGHWQGEIWNRRKNGELYAEWLSINTIRDAAGRITKYAAIFSDITKRKRYEEEVKNLAYFDSLTGLPNRRLLMDRLGQAIANAHRHGKPLAVMFLDLDLFKRINDTLGHDAGDRVLAEMARRLSGCVGEGDTVARIAGDEFVLVLSELADPAEAAKVAERAIGAVQRPVEIGGRRVNVTTSVGIAVYPEDGDSPEALLKCADLAMYQAKQGGRNGFQVYSPQLNARSHELLVAESRLRAALENREFTLAYQVKVDMTSGRMIGAEALIRWNHPEMGVLLPASFLPTAERMGLMPAIGEWVLTEACRQNRSWQDRGLPPIRMSVNVSPWQFATAELVDVVGRVLSDTRLAPQHLEIELTEAALLDHPAEVADAIERLHRLGVAVSIDDFGTCHSCISALRKLPIHALKIDRSFIAGLRGATQDGELVRAIIGLCHALGMRAVAEGVETVEQVKVLQQANCDEIQGHLVSRAVSPADLETLFNQDLLPAE
ncbi:EAL domain-containing protein [Azospirillum sp. TSO22-1]|uniref:EAL domain-containing protein n=1 Tax=Azospirillum sp. TSO22-1 TaxID=716789 RepID=UPI000D618E7D|nr:EAL domain-containing protein [Azospirillum sp. TSO22-1]PWC43492.1 histidine kinase [Azospirillum sp. TSO22-1]